jgi:selenocysteine lyase/cysteine desulfurase
VNSTAEIGQSVARNHTPAHLKATLAAFRQAYPSFDTTHLLDDLREREYARLDELDQVYLDYTGGGLFADSQLREHMDLLRNSVFGNPHSNNPTSLAMTRLVEQTRAYIGQYFKAHSDEYVVIFTPNASGALKHVAESYPFETGGRYLLTFDNHNSVNGIREYARAKGAKVDYVPLTQPDLRMDLDKLAESLDRAQPGKHNLFAYPAQSNFSGVQHPLELIGRAREKGWDVLVDCAAFAPTNRLDLSRWLPDFVSLSFYKMFGYPTGIGCLLARKSALAKLRRPWFAGGTIVLASVQGQAHHLADNEAAFEDGTVDYLNIPAVEIGLRHLEAINVDLIHERVRCLTGWLLDSLLVLRHRNGRPLVRIYGPTNLHMRGGTLTVNLYDPDEKMFDYRRVEELANEVNISLRTGCFCNPGANEIAEGLTEEDIAEGFKGGRRTAFPSFLSIIEHKTGKSAGAIRVSVGMVTNFADVFRLMQFVRTFLDKPSEKIGNVTFDIETCRVIRDGS